MVLKNRRIKAKTSQKITNSFLSLIKMKLMSMIIMIMVISLSHYINVTQCVFVNQDCLEIRILKKFMIKTFIN